MDALLWQRDAEARRCSCPTSRRPRAPVFAARLSILQGGDGATYDGSATSDPGYLWNRSRELRTEGREQEAVRCSPRIRRSAPRRSTRPRGSRSISRSRARRARKARSRSPRARGESFRSESEIARRPYKLRDDYTSLMWLGGTRALWNLGDGNAAAPLFYRYGAAAKTPQTRSKGFFWAGHAAQQAGNQAEATRYYRWPRPIPNTSTACSRCERLGRPGRPRRRCPPRSRRPSSAPRSSPARWRRRCRCSPRAAHLADQAQVLRRSSPTRRRARPRCCMVGELAQQLNLPELAVVVGRVAPEKGFHSFTQVGFPTVQTPAEADWTMVHAIARQESEFDNFAPATPARPG
jgi:soluble lytic murein transglycosylase